MDGWITLAFQSDWAAGQYGGGDGGDGGGDGGDGGGLAATKEETSALQPPSGHGGAEGGGASKWRHHGE